MTNLNLYGTPMIRMRYRTPRIDKFNNIYDLDTVNKIHGYSAIEEMVQHFKGFGGICIGSAVTIGQLHPLTFPYTVESGRNTRVVLDMRDYITAESAMEEQAGNFRIKSSKFNLAYVQLVIATSLAQAAYDDTSSSAINHVPMRAYTHWISEAVSKGKQVQNTYQVVAQIRVLCAAYFLGRLNNLDTLTGEEKLFFARNIQRQLRLPEDLVNDVLDKLVDGKDVFRSLGNLLAMHIDHPAFKDFGDSALVTILARHVNIDGNTELGGLAIDSPYVFAAILFHAFTREFNARSNFKTILENGPIDNRELQDWAKGYENILSR